MKEKLKDRIDVLFEKAKAGDNEAQLKLAKNFYRGHLVEKSIEQAQYWAFKSVSSGNLSAQSFYQNIHKSTGEKVSDHAHSLLFLFFILPYIEMALGLVVMIITNIVGYGDSIVASISTYCFGLGIFSIFASFLTGKIGEKITSNNGYIAGSSIGVVIIHVIGLLLFA